MKTMKNAALAAAAALAMTAPAGAVQQPFTEGFEDWTFTQDVEKTGVNCRAIRQPPGRLDILAFQSSGGGYLSVRAEGLKGEFPGAILRLTGRDIPIYGVVSGSRLLLGPVNEYTMDAIVQDGGYQYILPGSAGRTGEVDLGEQAGEALDQVFNCLQANARD